jgi:hypothetical protein
MLQDSVRYGYQKGHGDNDEDLTIGVMAPGSSSVDRRLVPDG